ncbi:MAG TPA: CBS domain-containing protein, partial [Terriglobales bacterium]|nr:CBS domain-containing protein [Terriglobales bacterium]
DAAADLLGDLTQERTEEILVQMQPEERQEVTELLEFEENTAAGRMTTEYIALPVAATAHDAIEAMRTFEGRMESMSTIFLIDSHGTLAGAVPLVKIVLAPSSTPLLALTQEPLTSCHADAKEKEFAELFDKYNLLTLPVIDEKNHLAGVITPDDVINMLRSKL